MKTKFTIKDLKELMVLEDRAGNKYIHTGCLLWGKDFCDNIYELDDESYQKERGHVGGDIMHVYEIVDYSVGYEHVMKDEDTLELIWSRDKKEDEEFLNYPVEPKLSTPLKTIEDVRDLFKNTSNARIDTICRNIIATYKIDDIENDMWGLLDGNGYAVSEEIFKLYKDIYFEMVSDENFNFEVKLVERWKNEINKHELSEEAINYISNALTSIAYDFAIDEYSQHVKDYKFNFDSYIKELEEVYGPIGLFLIGKINKLFDEYKDKNILNVWHPVFPRLIITDKIAQDKDVYKDDEVESVTEYGFTLQRTTKYNDKGEAIDYTFDLFGGEENKYYDDIVKYYKGLGTLRKDCDIVDALCVIADEIIDKNNNCLSPLYDYIQECNYDIEDIGTIITLRDELLNKNLWLYLNNGSIILNLYRDDADFFDAHKDILNEIQSKVKITNITDDGVMILKEVK